MVKHVPIVAILMMVQGVLSVVAGFWFAIGSIRGFGQVAQLTQGAPSGAVGIANATLVFLMLIGFASIITGGLNVFGGIRAQSFRGWTLALVALFSNVLPLCTGWMIPTSLGVAIYGLIVLFNTDVKRAFTMGEAGQSPEEIKAHFDKPMP